MSRPSAPNGDGWSSPRTSRDGDDDGWGPSTAVYSGGTRRVGRAFTEPSTDERPPRDRDEWNPGGPAPREQQRSNRHAARQAEQPDRRSERESARAAREFAAASRAPERGAPWWLALIVLIVIAVIGGVIDTVGSFQVRGGFNIGIVVASIVAIIMVKRSHMFPVVIAPPIVYSLAAVFQLYLRSGGLHDKKVVFDAAANYLVYGFPAIAAASAAVLIIAGFRLIAHK